MLETEKMVNLCAVFGCSNHSTREKRSFYRVPKILQRGDEAMRDLSIEGSWYERLVRKIQTYLPHIIEYAQVILYQVIWIMNIW